jgi:hypothetical protein
MDDHALNLILTASNFSAPAEFRTGWGMIQMEFTATPGALSAGAHRLTIHNRHLPGISVYLLNAAQPEFFVAASSKSHLIEITAQKRNETQSAGEIDFTFHPPPQPFKRDLTTIAFLAALLIAVFGAIGLGKRAGLFREETQELPSLVEKRNSNLPVERRIACTCLGGVHQLLTRLLDNLNKRQLSKPRGSGRECAVRAQTGSHSHLAGSIAGKIH